MLRWDREKCLHCGACAPICGQDAIIVYETCLDIDARKCIDCGACVQGCPTGALSVENARKELA